MNFSEEIGAVSCPYSIHLTIFFGYFRANLGNLMGGIYGQILLNKSYHQSMPWETKDIVAVAQNWTIAPVKPSEHKLCSSI